MTLKALLMHSLMGSFFASSSAPALIAPAHQLVNHPYRKLCRAAADDVRAGDMPQIAFNWTVRGSGQHQPSLAVGAVLPYAASKQNARL